MIKKREEQRAPQPSSLFVYEWLEQVPIYAQWESVTIQARAQRVPKVVEYHHVYEK
ncbi:MAG: hypothetical protein SVR94_14405 [Pseudomonadota bacterium]|nr:hypothetical protein [Pseudomonadota bacterium]